MNTSVSRPSHRGILRRALIVSLVAFGFGFAMVPLYRLTCEHVFGIRLERGPTATEKTTALAVDDTRWVTVQFVANVNSRLPWAFRPEATSLRVHPGEIAEAWFEAGNETRRAIVGNAVPSIAPASASLYFNKTECFCFTEQLLQAGETRRMPVRFFVDPKLPAGIDTLTLSYTFYENDIATRKLAETTAGDAPAS